MEEKQCCTFKLKHTYLLTINRFLTGKYKKKLLSHQLIKLLYLIKSFSTDLLKSIVISKIPMH